MSLLGIPDFLSDNYPTLRYFKPEEFSVDRYRFAQGDPDWVYDAETQTTIPLSPANRPRRNNDMFYLDRQSQAFAESVIVPLTDRTGSPPREYPSPTT